MDFEKQLGNIYQTPPRRYNDVPSAPPAVHHNKYPGGLSINSRYSPYPSSPKLTSFTNTSPPARTKFYSPGQKKFEYECVFCKGNNQPEYVYKNHPIRINETVICPLLRNLTCSLCGATGDNAHTIKYCPFNERGFFSGAGLFRKGPYVTLEKVNKPNQLQPAPMTPVVTRPRSAEESGNVNNHFMTKPKAVRKLNFDGCPISSSALFLKNLQQIPR